MTVNGALTPNRRYRRRRYRTNADFAAMVTRMIRTMGRRAADADPDELRMLLDLGAEVSDAIDTAVAGLRDAGFTWESISEATGHTRQAAFQRWGKR